MHRAFNPSLEDFLTAHGTDTLLRQGVPPESIVVTLTAFNGRPAGGCFAIRDEDRDLFLRLYFQRLKRSGPFSSVGTALFLNEKTAPTRPFRYYVDIDMDDDAFEQLNSVVGDGQPLKVYRVIADVLARIVSNVTGDTVYPIFSRRKSGKLHYQFPTAICDHHMAKSFTEMAREQLKQMYPDFSTWDRIFDLGVYSSGLRMIGSRKFTPAGGPQDEEERVYKPFDLSTVSLGPTRFWNVVAYSAGW